MPRYSKPHHTWKSRVRVWTIPVIALLCVAGFLYENHSFEHQQQTTWITAPAIAADTRIRPIARFSLQYGGKPLFEIDVLASFTVNTVPYKDWIPLSEAPTTEPEARSEAALIHGNKCLVRWDPAHPDQKIVELR